MRLTPRWATTAVFAVNGAVIGTWAAQIPWVQERFGLSKGALGLVLVGMGLAVIVAFPIAGQAVARHGSVRVVWVGGVAGVLALNLPVLAPQPLLVALGLTLLGAASATQDVAMNSHGVEVETDVGRPIMSSLHAGWAFGGILGASFAAACTAFGLDPRGRRCARVGAPPRPARRVCPPHRGRVGGLGRRHARLHAPVARRDASRRPVLPRDAHRGGR